MNFTNVRLILGRELRDQLRDRRTLFMMFVLPVLLYPLLGMSFVHVRQFMQEKPVKIWVIGAEQLPKDPALIDEERFSESLFNDPTDTALLQLSFATDREIKGADPRELGKQMIKAGKYDAVLYFPNNFAVELSKFREKLKQHSGQADRGKVPWPEIIHTSAHEKSQIALARLTWVRDRWTAKISELILESRGLPIAATQPVRFNAVDVAGQTGYRGAAWWSKILPVLMLIWALTGAFYPAIDLCAGEKERGTLETLLCSPAQRSEIVVGKLLTIMIFSMATAILNLLSVGISGWLVFGGRPEFAMPSPVALLWLAAALIPISALFSALCLALAALARSSKEGQYYLMPLLLITMPLAVMPMTPGVELGLGNSLVPVTGIVLLLRSVLEGSYLTALQYLPVVLLVTLGSCLLAIRWAIDQFNSESVLFHESERLDLWHWLRHLRRDRKPKPTVGAAVLCAALILLLQFYVGATMTLSGGWLGLITAVMVPQLFVILAPALLLTFLLTRNPRETLLLNRPRWLTLPAVMVLAVVLHPAVNTLKVAVMQLYPVSEKMKQALAGLIPEDANFWSLFLLVAMVPAICEELAFRGFILSGFRHTGQKWRAIVLTAVAFGITHAILQQQLLACVVGVVIGFIAVQTGSVLPCILFHIMHNGLGLATIEFLPGLLERWPILKHVILENKEVSYTYRWSVVLVASLIAAKILLWLGKLPYRKTAEEELQATIRLKALAEKKGIVGKPLAASQQS